MKQASNIYCKDVMAEQFAEQIARAFSERPLGRRTLCRFEIGIDKLSLTDWLGVQADNVKIYFSGRQDDLKIAGVGVADLLTDANGYFLREALGTIEENLSTSRGNMRYFGGVCFDSDSEVVDEWKGFGRYRFVVPRFEICRQNDNYTLAFNVMCDPRDDRDSVTGMLLGCLDELIFDGDVEQSESNGNLELLKRTDLPASGQWIENVSEVVKKIETGDISKVVLARKSILDVSGQISPIELLQQIKQIACPSYNFCFQFDVGQAFIGSTPECLFRKNGEEVYSEAVAGTLLKALDDDQRQILKSEKELKEHKFVFDNVLSVLEKLCDRVEIVSEREVITLRHLYHICSRFNGVCKENVSICDLVENLHPTAAVNGYPKQRAREIIREYEPFSRGWYAGPVGWIGRGCADFAVGIRSALVSKNDISLFAGAGIIDSSDPTLEWDELENKLRQFMEVIY